ncbi:class IV adenylate cyclase [Aeromonas veronii]|uniref:class IV adenylate cyclase n=1 Tax=Aeromonas veronii TaxID=654 RepID=UPI001F43BF6B|nr:class IV adenylate cyclase [Aeromonas veronii]MCF5883560.1 class IV adenylate cyclase [Aeromonas veronii]
MSQAHFQGRFEVEFKYRLTDRPAFLKALLALNPEIMLEDNLEQDRYFDTPDDALAQAGKSLAIRTMQLSGIQLWIVKGPETDRCEAVTINDADKAVSMLLAMNYRQILVITKRRSIYFIGPFNVTLDHLAEIGDFAELAIMTDDEKRLPAFRQQLLALADQLGLSPDAQELHSYRTLYTRYMQTIHITQPEDATQ